MIALFALRHQKKLRAVNRVTQRASESADAARRVASNRKVRKETRSAVAALTLAGERARQVGLIKASSDKKLAGHLRRASGHASRAVTMAERASHKPRQVRKAATITIGAGALSAAAYAAWRMYVHPQPNAAASPSSDYPTAGTTWPTAEEAELSQDTSPTEDGSDG
jgi:hypothetical protein